MSHSPTPALEDFVDALSQSAGQLMLIINHMSQFADRCDPDGPSFDAVLRGLITDVLAPVVADRDEDLRTAAGLIRETIDAVAGEVLLVPITEFDD